MTAVRLLIDLLAGRTGARDIAARDWPALFAVAKAEALMGTLAEIVADGLVHSGAAAMLADVRAANVQARRLAMWEAEMARHALGSAGVRFILLKGAAYAAADLPAARGRQIGDLDILVAEADLAAAETALRAAGWEWVKEDAYDDQYYRRWMHELPPLIHKDRDRMIDVHHNILPRTHRASPDANRLLAAAVATGSGYWLLSPEDRLIHCAAHCLADGDLQGGLRNLHDFHHLLTDYISAGGTRAGLIDAGRQHELADVTARAIRLSDDLYGAKGEGARLSMFDRLIRTRLLSRDDMGRETRRLLGLFFYIRSHLLRMPAGLLFRHLWTKWRR